MATSKTLTPTNVSISIPDFTDAPDQRVNSNCIDKEADAINDLMSKKAFMETTPYSNTTLEAIITSLNSKYGNNYETSFAAYSFTDGHRGGVYYVVRNYSLSSKAKVLFCEGTYETGTNYTLDSIYALNNKFTEKKTVLAWDTYENGTYNMSYVPSNNMLCRIWIGANNNWGELRCFGSAGDAWKFYTQDGITTVTFSATQVTVSNAGANSKVRSIAAYPGFVF